MRKFQVNGEGNTLQNNTALSTLCTLHSCCTVVFGLLTTLNFTPGSRCRNEDAGSSRRVLCLTDARNGSNSGNSDQIVIIEWLDREMTDGESKNKTLGLDPAVGTP